MSSRWREVATAETQPERYQSSLYCNYDDDDEEEDDDDDDDDDDEKEDDDDDDYDNNIV